MIRERRPEDLEPLCTVLAALGLPTPDSTGGERAAWLTERDAELSWVFDMAPVTVAPTQNVVGHVQVYRPVPAAARRLAEQTGRPPAELLAIGRLFVRPSTHQYGFARHLLKQAAAQIRARGALPVVDQHENAFPADGFCERYGFSALGSGWLCG